MKISATVFPDSSAPDAARTVTRNATRASTSRLRAICLKKFVARTVVLCGCLSSILSLDCRVLAQDKLDNLGAPATAAKAEGSDRIAEVRQLIRQLDSDKLAERDAAEKRLIEIGPSVVSLLPDVSGETSGEMKIRLQRIREQLQQTNIETFFDPSLITLKGKMQLSDAIAAIAEQSGNVIKLENVESSEVELTADKEPFWKVMDKLLSDAKLRINTFSAVEGMSLSPSYGEPATPGPSSSITGPFHVRMISTQTSLPFDSPLPGQLDVSLQVSWEPRLKPVFIQLPMSKMKAKASDEDEVAATNPEATPEIPLNTSGCSAQIDLQFVRPPRSARKLEKLSGEFVIAVPSEKHKFVFEKFGNGKRQTEKYGEVTVTLENARRNGKIYEMRIVVDFEDSQGALDSFRGWILSNRAYLLDAKQNRLENVGLETYPARNNAVGVAFLFQINGDPNDYTLVYESPGMITRQSVSFELSDIELP